MEQITGAIGRPALAATTMPPPRVCADVGPVIDAAVRFKKWSRGKETDHEGPLGYNWTWAASSLLRFAFLLTTRCFAFVEVSSLEVWLSHVPPNVRLQIWFSTVDLLHLQGMAQWFRFSSRLSKESCDDSSFRTWVTVWHLKEPLMRMMITSRSRQDSRENMRKPLVAHVELSAFLSDAAFQEETWRELRCATDEASGIQSYLIAVIPVPEALFVLFPGGLGVICL
ncbi:unnamed protein product [Symbiodinium natans]|uniref:Uncharacterized protein n=1 Tax=Symbiodinium natans TaxID=878477 RepID=A0A812UC32_9DINO|nr:unnamed protein product [Symbiodinium natans]